MKFQDDISNMNTYVRTYIRTSRNQYAPPLFQSWGHNKPTGLSLTSFSFSNSVAIPVCMFMSSLSFDSSRSTAMVLAFSSVCMYSAMSSNTFRPLEINKNYNSVEIEDLTFISAHVLLNLLLGYGKMQGFLELSKFNNTYRGLQPSSILCKKLLKL